MKKKNSYPFLFLTLLLLSFCKKEYDVPPLKQANDGSKLTIAAIKARYNSNAVLKFSGDTNLYCVVIADETSGNLYKEVYVRDATGALHIKLVTPGGLFIGDSIRINLNTVLLDAYFNLIQLDSVDVSKSVVKLASGLDPQPRRMTISQVNANTSPANAVQSQLIQIEGCEFASASQNQPYANAVTKASGQYTLQDCAGNKIAVRTSGYAYFASENTPGGNGSLIAIASQYNSTMQLTLRTSSEVNMNGPLCAAGNLKGVYLTKDFNDNNVSSGGWTVQQPVGSIGWTTSIKGAAQTPYGQISNYISGKNTTCETWLIAPAIDLSASVSPVLSFMNAYNYAGPSLALYVSTDYTGGLTSSATWFSLSYSVSTGSFISINSGNIPLDNYKSLHTRFAFKYTGTGFSGSTWEIDDISVKEK